MKIFKTKSILFAIATALVVLTTLSILQSCSKDETMATDKLNSDEVSSIILDGVTLEKILNDKTFQEYCTNKNDICVAFRNITDEEQVQIAKICQNFDDNQNFDDTELIRIFSNLEIRIGYDVIQRLRTDSVLFQKLEQRYNIQKFSKSEKNMLLSWAIKNNLFFNKMAMVPNPDEFVKGHGINFGNRRFKLSGVELTNCNNACIRSYNDDLDHCEGSAFLALGVSIKSIKNPYVLGGAALVAYVGYWVCVSSADTQLSNCKRLCALE